jgi:hypothetical protein
VTARKGKLTPNQREALEGLDFANHRSLYPRKWVQPMDIGGTNGSHHSGSLNALAKKGLVQFKQRGGEDPPDGENGRKIWAGRGAKVYRIRAAGRAALGKAPA